MDRKTIAEAQVLGFVSALLSKHQWIADGRDPGGGFKEIDLIRDLKFIGPPIYEALTIVMGVNKPGPQRGEDAYEYNDC
jgi:hypothetical protein